MCLNGGHMRGFSPRGITCHCLVISIVRGKNSALTLSCLAYAKVLPSSRKEDEESETALVSFIWLKGKGTFALNEREHQVFQGQENQLYCN